MFNFSTTYKELGEMFSAETHPTAFPSATLILCNEELCAELGLLNNDIESIRNYLATGALELEAGLPLAMAYAGHQFGHFTMLGDGRAMLLGEHLTPSGIRFDIQLKGAGPTEFSRGGDGWATYRSVLREYVMSECMFALGVPSSRSLNVIKSGLKIRRESIHDGAILTRVMTSHLRVGTFEYARNFLSDTQFSSLLDYAVKRLYPDLEGQDNKALLFLKRVGEKQVDLVLNWMRIGFIHGVMNTDNVAISGETFDYGPCSFMNTYDPKTVYSSIDRQGRYSFQNQPDICLWNMSVLAGSLLPDIHKDQEKAVELAKETLNNLADSFRTKYQLMMAAKLGFSQTNEEIQKLLQKLLVWMKENKADYTNSFLVVEGVLNSSAIPQNDEFKNWLLDWQKYIESTTTMEDAKMLMERMNPRVIPRNEQVERALDLAVYSDDLSALKKLIEMVKNPTGETLGFYQNFDPSFDQSYRTFCGT